MSKRKKYRCLRCKGDRKFRRISPPTPSEKVGIVDIRVCTICEGKGWVTKKLFEWQVKKGFTEMNNLEIMEAYANPD